MILDSPYISGSTTIENSLTASSAVFSGNLTITGDVSSTGGLTGSLEGTASVALNAISSSHALSADNAISSSFAATSSFADTFTVAGEIVAQTLNVQQVTSSVVYSSGSNVFGNSLSNTQQFTGSLQVSGSTHYMLGNVGIGTTSVTNGYKLDLNGRLRAVGAASNYLADFISTESNGSFLQIYADNSNVSLVQGGTSAVPMTFYIGGSERMRIDSSGNVGIGTTSPALKLHLVGTSGLPATSGTSQNGGIRIENGANNGVLDIGASSATGAPGWIQATDKVDLSQTYNLLLNPNGGDVGIGTTTPSYKLHNTGTFGFATDITGNIGVMGANTATADTYFTLRNTAGRFDVGTSATGHYFYGVGALPLQFFTNATERMRIDSAGKVGINNSTPNSFFSNASQLVIGDGSTSRGMTIYGSSAGDSQIFFADGTTGNEQYRGVVRYEHSSDSMVLFTSGAEKMRIDSSGNTTITSTNENALRLINSGGQPSLIRFNDTSTTNDPYIGSYGNALAFGIYGVGESIRIDSSRNVGIGTNSPSSKLTVLKTITTNPGATGNAALSLGTAGSAGEYNLINFGYDSGTWQPAYLGYLTTSGAGSTNGALVFATRGVTTDSQPTERMRITSAGLIGIGNTNPNAKLDLGAAIGGTYREAFFIYNDNNAGPYYGTKNGFYMDQFSLSNNTTLAFSTAAGAPGTLMFASKNTEVNDSTSLTTRMTIAGQTGNVGIGNNSPLTKLVVNNAISGNILPYIQGTGLSYNNEGISVAGSNTNNTNIGNGLTLYNNVASIGAYGPPVAWSSMTAGGAYNSTYAFITGIYGGAGGDANWAIGDLIFGTAAAYGASEKMRIKHNGNVGIGTDTPGAKLDVASGLINISNGFGGPNVEAAFRLRFYDNGGVHNDPGIGLDGSGEGGEQMWFNSLAGFYWGLGTGGTKMKMNAAGDVGINQTSPAAKLHVNGTTKVQNSGGTDLGFQTVTGVKTATGSGTGVDVAYIGHSHAIQISAFVIEDTSNVSTALGSISTAYGSTTGGVNQQANIGNVTNIAISYVNSGGATNYVLRITPTYSGAAPNIHFTITGISHDTMYVL